MNPKLKWTAECERKRERILAVLACGRGATEDDIEAYMGLARDEKRRAVKLVGFAKLFWRWCETNAAPQDREAVRRTLGAFMDGKILADRRAAIHIRVFGKFPTEAPAALSAADVPAPPPAPVRQDGGA